VCYMENYRFYKDSVGQISHLDSIKAIGSSVGWFFNEGLKFLAADRVTEGVNLAEFQHGGNYGMSLSISAETIALEKDVFYTWGWVSKGDKRTRAIPNPYLFRLKDSHSASMDKLLFVSTEAPRYYVRFDTALLPEDMPKYLEDEKIFLQGLAVDARNKILYRPPTNSYGWGGETKIKEICPDCRFVSEKILTTWMQKVKLVVIDHPHTAFIEALTINVPCVFYWDHDVYLMRPEAERYFDLLRDAGILFKDPLSAARKASEIFDNPKAWWLTDSVQKARIEFCRKYAYTAEDWATIWERDLNSLRTDYKRQ